MNKPSGAVLRLIAVFKLLKAATLIAAGIGALRLVHNNEALEHWIRVLGIRPGGHLLDAALGKLASVPPRRLRELGVGSFIYAGLFLTEGIGLWLNKRWAEWFTTIITASLVPLEMYELFRHPTIGKVAVLAINVAVVVYLILRIRRERLH